VDHLKPWGNLLGDQVPERYMPQLHEKPEPEPTPVQP
jgi:hypothetical protein